MIPGDPAAIEAAADAIAQASTGLDQASAAVRRDAAQTLQAWRGPAADGAGALLDACATRTAVGGDLAADVAPVLRRYASELRAAQQQYDEGLALVPVLPPVLPAGAPGLTPEELAGQQEGNELMAAAVRRADAAGANASREIDAITARVGEMQVPAPPGTTTPYDPRKPLDQILRDYQVNPDPRGMTRPLPLDANPWGSNPRITQTEADMLDELGLVGRVEMQQQRMLAEVVAADQFPQGERDGHQDAFRHTYWNALLAADNGQDWAARFTTAHEAITGNPPDQEAMDLHNNEVGRRIAVEHPGANPAELERHVREAVDRGDVVVIDQNGDLAYSDQVAPGNTGAPNDPPPEDAVDERPRPAQSAGENTSGTASDQAYR